MLLSLAVVYVNYPSNLAAGFSPTPASVKALVFTILRLERRCLVRSYVSAKLACAEIEFLEKLRIEQRSKTIQLPSGGG